MAYCGSLTLTLTWRNSPGLGGFGKATQVGEVWLVRTEGAR
jgi:hypothetical protein